MMTWRIWTLLLWIPCLMPPAAQAAPLLHADKRVIAVAGVGKVEVEQGVLRVPESRLQATGRRIEIPWLRLTSTAPHPGTPIFMLAGGPGASGLDNFEQPEVFREVMFYRSVADVVLFDQRGAGHSMPELTCPQTMHYPDDQVLDWTKLRKSMRRLLVACRDHWRQQGIDLSAYNTMESAADVDDLREALGYDKITLIGGSYGSHLALAVMRQFPHAVARTVLYGIEGPGQTWDDPDGVLAALQRYDAALQASSESLDLRIPEGGWLAALARVERRLVAHPVRMAIQRGGATTRVTVDASLVQLMARRRAGSHDDMRAWANMIGAMDGGDYSMAARAARDFRTLRLDDPMHYSMDCASGVSAARRNDYARSEAAGLLGDINREYAIACDLWPSRNLGEAYRDNVESTIPTLLFQGTWDVSTPLENAREVAGGLPQGQLVTVVGGNHGVLYNLYDHWPPMHALMRTFLAGQPVAAPATIVMPWAKTASSRIGN